MGRPLRLRQAVVAFTSLAQTSVITVTDVVETVTNSVAVDVTVVACRSPLPGTAKDCWTHNMTLIMINKERILMKAEF